MENNNNNTTEIILEDFSQPKHKWKTMNDPVMGGKSYSLLSINNKNGIGIAIFEGEVVDVPFLHSPGFITMKGDGNYPDVSSCQSILLTARSTMLPVVPPYSGYRISFGTKHVPGNRYAYGFKANFNFNVDSNTITNTKINTQKNNKSDINEKESMIMMIPMSKIEIPFQNFTVRWDDTTGDPITTCQENEQFCPDVKTLLNMKTISIWAEGVSGEVQLEIESIKAIHCDKGGSLNFDAVGGGGGNGSGMGFVNNNDGFMITSNASFGIVIVAVVLSLMIMFRFNFRRVQSRHSNTYATLNTDKSTV